MTTETRRALEEALLYIDMPSTGALMAIAVAARAHLASERSEAVAALERLRAKLLAEGFPIEQENGPDFDVVAEDWVRQFIDAELDRLRPPEAA